jgi:hypothetical protein
MILVSLACILQPALIAFQAPEWDTATLIPTIVKRALHKQPHWRFTGTRTVTFRRKAQPIEYTEYVTRDGWNLRIEYPSDSRYSGQIVVETETDRRHFDPKTNVIHITPPRREPLFEHIRGVWRGDLRVTDQPGQRVAGLSTRLVKILDDKGNRLQELNIEPRSGVVLAYRWFDKVGTPLGSSTFTEINLHPAIDSALFVLRRKGTRITTPEDDLKKAVEKTDFLPLQLPNSTGLYLDSARVRNIAGQSVLMSQYIAPKGAGRVFLFQLAAGVDPHALESNAPKHVQVVTAKIQGRWFVLVGPLAESKLREAISTLRSGP